MDANVGVNVEGSNPEGQGRGFPNVVVEKQELSPLQRFQTEWTINAVVNELKETPALEGVIPTIMEKTLAGELSSVTDLEAVMEEVADGIFPKEYEPQQILASVMLEQLIKIENALNGSDCPADVDLLTMQSIVKSGMNAQGIGSKTLAEREQSEVGRLANKYGKAYVKLMEEIGSETVKASIEWALEEFLAQQAREGKSKSYLTSILSGNFKPREWNMNLGVKFKLIKNPSGGVEVKLEEKPENFLKEKSGKQIVAGKKSEMGGANLGFSTKAAMATSILLLAALLVCCDKLKVDLQNPDLTASSPTPTEVASVQTVTQEPSPTFTSTVEPTVDKAPVEARVNEELQKIKRIYSPSGEQLIYEGTQKYFKDPSYIDAMRVGSDIIDLVNSNCPVPEELRALSANDGVPGLFDVLYHAPEEYSGPETFTITEDCSRRFSEAGLIVIITSSPTQLDPESNDNNYIIAFGAVSRIPGYEPEWIRGGYGGKGRTYKVPNLGPARIFRITIFGQPRRHTEASEFFEMLGGSGSRTPDKIGVVFLPDPLESFSD